MTIKWRDIQPMVNSLQKNSVKYFDILIKLCIQKLFYEMAQIRQLYGIMYKWTKNLVV